MELERADAPVEERGAQTESSTAKSEIAEKEGNTPVAFPESKHSVLGESYTVIKRCFDFLSALVVSVVILIPLLILMLLIVIKDPGSPLYFQKRVGKGGKPIYVAKLRSMRKGADHLEEMLTPEQLEEYLCEYKLKDDPRLIGWKKSGDGKRCFGGLLRRFSLDELPQIPFNICIKGDMSVVGPRPVLLEELEKNYTKEEQQEILSVKPGLTGYWQAFARNDAAYETDIRQQMELYYVRNRSLSLDIRILLHTVITVLSTKGGY